MAAKADHDLIIDGTAWNATVQVPGADARATTRPAT
jgi:hypothetical protein